MLSFPLSVEASAVSFMLSAYLLGLVNDECSDGNEIWRVGEIDYLSM